MKQRAHAEAKQPDWVCRDCGGKWGLWWDDGYYYGPPAHCATFHEDKCGVCGKTTGVTQARDYGYLREGWQKEFSSVNLKSCNSPPNEGNSQNPVQGETI